MEEDRNIHNELRRLEDVIETIEEKLHNTAGLLELIRLGIERLNKLDDSYEISSLYILKEYIQTINDEEITKIKNMLAEINEYFNTCT